MAVAHQIKPAVVRQECAEVQARQIAGGVIQEHVLRAGVGSIDAAILGAGVPVIDGGVELQARIGAGPGRSVDLLPEITGQKLLGCFSIGAVLKFEITVTLQRPHEGVRHPHRVVGIHAAHRGVGIAIPRGVIALDVAVEIAIGETAQTLAQEGCGHAFFLGAGQGMAQGFIGLGIRILGGGAFDGFADEVPMTLHQLAAHRQHGDLALFGDLPINEGFDIRMIQIECHHFGGATRGAAALDGARGLVPHRQEAHQARAAAAATQGFFSATELGEIATGAGAVLEDAGLAGPQIHDAARVHQIVRHALDKAGVGLGPLVGGRGFLDIAGFRVHVAVALGRAGDAVGVVQAGVEPLRRIGRAHLLGEHVGQLVVEGLGVLGCIEVTVGLAPMTPAARHPMEDLPGIGFAAIHGVDAFAAEILLGQDVHGHLGPGIGHHHIPGFEDHGSIQLGDLADTRYEGDSRERLLAFTGKMARNLHWDPRTIYEGCGIWGDGSVQSGKLQNQLIIQKYAEMLG